MENLSLVNEFDDEPRIEVPAIPVRQDLIARGQSILDALKGLHIESINEASAVDEYRQECVTTQKLIVDQAFKEAREYYHGMHAKVMEAQKVTARFFQEGEELARNLLKAFDERQKRIREEAAAKLRREAEEILRKQQEAAAAKLDAEGKTEEAVQVLDEPIAPVPTPEVKLESSTGNAYRDGWKHRVVDVNAVPRQFLIVDDRALAAYARAANGKQHAPNPIAGIEFYNDKILIGRS